MIFGAWLDVVFWAPFVMSWGWLNAKAAVAFAVGSLFLDSYLIVPD
jgi:hypothetical protein